MADTEPIIEVAFWKLEEAWRHLKRSGGNILAMMNSKSLMPRLLSFVTAIGQEGNGTIK